MARSTIALDAGRVHTEKVRALAITAALTIVAALPSPAHAFCRTTTSGTQPDPTVCPVGGVPLAWPGGCASVSINPSFVPDGITLDQFRQEVSNAAGRWSGADCGSGANPSFHFVAYPDCPHAAEWNPNGPNANTVTFSTTWGNDAFHPPDAIAITITTYGLDSGQIRDADTELNTRSSTNPSGDVFTVGTPTASEVDLPTVLTHEMGHAHGLAHSQFMQAVMYFQARLGEQTRMLQPDDVQGICTIYPPSRQAACNPEPSGGFECATGGCHCSAPGRSSVRNPLAWLAAALALSAMRFARSRRRR